MVALTVLAARNLIATYWKSLVCPSLNQLKDKLRQFYVYKRMSLDSPTKSKKFHETWAPWLSLM
ncbi:Hypothetical predicted protein, partial [Pelobates cultripes]